MMDSGGGGGLLKSAKHENERHDYGLKRNTTRKGNLSLSLPPSLSSSHVSLSVWLIIDRGRSTHQVNSLEGIEIRSETYARLKKKKKKKKPKKKKKKQNNNTFFV